MGNGRELEKNTERIEMSKSLVALAEQAAALETALVESGGELTPELEAMLAELDVKLPEKVDNYSMILDRMSMLSDFYIERAERLLKMSKAATLLKERLKDNIKIAMEKLGETEIQGVETKFKLVQSNPSVVIENEELIDAAYKVQEIKIKVEKKRIAEDLKLGVDVRGARLERTTSLREYANTPNRKA